MPRWSGRGTVPRGVTGRPRASVIVLAGPVVLVRSAGAHSPGVLVIELILAPGTAFRFRFALSPLEEALAAVQVLLGVRGHPAHRPWRESVADSARRLPLAALRRVLGAGHYTTDFLSPPPAGTATTAREQLAVVRGTPPAQVAAELALVDADLRSLPADPAQARDLLADQVELAWTELVEPEWPRLREALLADIAHRSRQLADGGVAEAIADLHARVRLSCGPAGDVLTVSGTTRMRTRLDERGLLLVPSVFGWPRGAVIVVPPRQPTLLYPARGAGSLWPRPASSVPHPPSPSLSSLSSPSSPALPASPAPDSSVDAALSAVVGRTKALLLLTLAEPAHTAALARQLGLSAGTVSEHLTALRDAGLLTADRSGRMVRYRRSPLGEELARHGRGA